MASLEEIRNVRLEKLALLKERGIDPYPSTNSIQYALQELEEKFDALLSDSKDVTAGGRVMSLREQGALIFIDLFDGTAKFQTLFHKEKLGDEAFDFFSKIIDIGDFIEVTGLPFITKRGQHTIEVHAWNMLSKSLRPLPEKWHGLQDIEERYRKRYLDILSNPELRALFEQKAKFWDAARSFMKKNGFLEVETPTLELTTGGAEANPFKTYHKDFDLAVFMRISVGELWQKRLMAAGFPKTFEIGRIYRNEGSSPEHLQEFTNLEFYWAYADYEKGMKLVADMYRTIANEVFGTTVFTTRGHTFDLADEWVHIDYREEIIRQTDLDIEKTSDAELKNKLEELHVKYEGANRERLMDSLWKHCRKSIAGPAFLINHPKLVAPLAKSKKDNPHAVQMFQPILAGSELGRGYSELNDPIDQKERFEVQQKLLEGGDTEAMMPEWDFVEMLEYGMPPTCGFGFGERLFAFLADKPLRETQLFPLMRPLDTEN
jgi:lysyl-tRNA synthetase class 2